MRMRPAVRNGQLNYPAAEAAPDDGTSLVCLHFLPPPIIVRVIQGHRTRRFLQEQNKYWAGHFGDKAGWPGFTNNPPPAQVNFPQWPPAWPWTPKAPSPTSFPPLLAPAPAPSPVDEPKPMLQPRHTRTPAQSIVLPPQPAVVPSNSGPAVAGAAAGARHSGLNRPVYVIAAAGGSLLAAVSVALFVLCYRSSKVVTVRPWATGLSGQLQKAFVTGDVQLSFSFYPFSVPLIHGDD